MNRIITLVFRETKVEAALYEGCTLLCTAKAEEGKAGACARKIAESLPADGQVTAVICPGGCLKPVMAGCYVITQQALWEAKHHRYGIHRYNYLMEICWELAGLYTAAPYFADAMSIDELLPLNRVSSHAKVKKYSRGYALEHRAAMAKAAAGEARRPEDMNYIVAHMDDFVSIGAYEHGRCVDINDGSGGEGPMGFTASGDIPCAQMAGYFCKSSFSYEEMQELLLKKSGILQYLGTECPKEMDAEADAHGEADLIVRTMAYQTAKWIGSSALVLRGKADAILLSGRGVHSRTLMRHLVPRIEKIAPVRAMEELDLSGYLAARAGLAGTGLCPVREY